MTNEESEKLRLLNDGPNPSPRQRKNLKPSTKDKETTQAGTKTGGVQVSGQTEPTNVVFRPNEGPQTDFLASNEFQVLYGGAAGGGKSYAMLVDPLRSAHNKNFNALLLRRTNDELRDLIQESKKLYPQVFPKAQWKEREHTWVFPSGARLWMSFVDRDDDVMRYQGQQFTWVGFDELTQWSTPYAWNYLSSRLRTTDPTLKVAMRASTNPGGPGAWWVKKMFIDPAVPGTSFWATDMESGETLTDIDPESETYGQPLFKRKFVPAKLKDNPYLTRDPSYRLTLMSMPEHQRRQLLEGDWDAADGVAFPEWRSALHTIEPFDIPRGWTKFRSCDYGYGSYSGVLWYAVSPSNQIIVYREMYVKKRLAVDLADDIVKIERDDGNIVYGVLDSSMWHQRGDYGPSLAEKMMARGCRWRPSDRSKGARVSSKNEIHRLLQVNEFTNEPGLVVFNTCRNLISQLPSIPLDRKNPEDVDTTYEHDHLYDALRYGVQSRPRFHDYGDDEFFTKNQFDDYVAADPVFGY